MLRNESDPASSIYAASLSMRKQSLVWAGQFAAETNLADRRLARFLLPPHLSIGHSWQCTACLAVVLFLPFTLLPNTMTLCCFALCRWHTDLLTVGA